MDIYNVTKTNVTFTFGMFFYLRILPAHLSVMDGRQTVLFNQLSKKNWYARLLYLLYSFKINVAK